jgi:hypothetical protein
MTTLTWTSMTIDTYITNVHSCMDQLRTAIAGVRRPSTSFARYACFVETSS